LEGQFQLLQLVAVVAVAIQTGKPVVVVVVVDMTDCQLLILVEQALLGKALPDQTGLVNKTTHKGAVAVVQVKPMKWLLVAMACLLLLMEQQHTELVVVEAPVSLETPTVDLVVVVVALLQLVLLELLTLAAVVA
jgi:hypothetical protein